MLQLITLRNARKLITDDSSIAFIGAKVFWQFVAGNLVLKIAGSSFSVPFGGVEIDGITFGAEADLEMALGNFFLIPAGAPDLWQLLTMQGKGFTAVTGFVTVGSANETDFALIRNPAGSGVLLRFKEFILTLGGGATNTSIIRFYRSPTITNVGTPITINKALATGSQVSQILAYQTPTISNRGTLIQLFSIDFKSFIRDQGLARYLVEGADLLITVDGSVANIEHNITGVWAEETT